VVFPLVVEKQFRALNRWPLQHFRLCQNSSNILDDERAHKVADHNVGRYHDEYMDIARRQFAMDDGNARLAANLPDDLTHPYAYLSMQHFEAVFWFLGESDDEKPGSCRVNMAYALSLRKWSRLRAGHFLKDGSE